ncbi:hypothetical protein CF123_12520 [Aeromonas veronii]|uniref:Secreted protein n=1 Tax=Aeromonas veronii TaxID=654 RepID=A0AAX2UTE6_AERVE|nr:hypothetical protein CF123_12520 [Aeromonas veronii]
MVLAEGSALVRQPLPAATRAARLFLHAIASLYRTIQIPAGLPHPAHKKTGPPKWACCYLCDREYRNKRRYSRSFT